MGKKRGSFAPCAYFAQHFVAEFDTKDGPIGHSVLDYSTLYLMFMFFFVIIKYNMFFTTLSDMYLMLVFMILFNISGKRIHTSHEGWTWKIITRGLGWTWISLQVQCLGDFLWISASNIRGL